MDYGNFAIIEKLPSCKSAIYRPRTSTGFVTATVGVMCVKGYFGRNITLVKQKQGTEEKDEQTEIK